MRQRQRQNDVTIEVYGAVEITGASVRVNGSICCHRTHCLRQEQIDVVAPCEWALTPSYKLYQVGPGADSKFCKWLRGMLANW